MAQKKFFALVLTMTILVSTILGIMAVNAANDVTVYRNGELITGTTAYKGEDNEVWVRSHEMLNVIFGLDPSVTNFPVGLNMPQRVKDWCVVFGFSYSFDGSNLALTGGNETPTEPTTQPTTQPTTPTEPTTPAPTPPASTVRVFRDNTEIRNSSAYLESGKVWVSAHEDLLTVFGLKQSDMNFPLGLNIPQDVQMWANSLGFDYSLIGTTLYLTSGSSTPTEPTTPTPTTPTPTEPTTPTPTTPQPQPSPEYNFFVNGKRLLELSFSIVKDKAYADKLIAEYTQKGYVVYSDDTDIYFHNDGNKPVKVYIQHLGKYVRYPDQIPILYSKTEKTLLAFRALAEDLGFNVNWEQSSSTVTASDGATQLVMRMGYYEYSIIKNGITTSQKFITPPMIINDRSMVELRSVFEYLGYTVQWDGFLPSGIGHVTVIRI